MIFVVIDVGCHECGVGSEVVGSFLTKKEADTAMEARDKATGRWRDGGQTLAEVFAVELPANWAER